MSFFIVTQKQRRIKSRHASPIRRLNPVHRSRNSLNKEASVFQTALPMKRRALIFHDHSFLEKNRRRENCIFETFAARKIHYKQIISQRQKASILALVRFQFIQGFLTTN